MAFPTPTTLPATADRTKVYLKVFAFDEPQAEYVVPLDGSEAGSGINGIISGEVVLVAGVATIANTAITATSRIFLSRRTVAGTAGNLGFTRNVGVGFSITNSSATDTSIVNYMVLP